MEIFDKIQANPIQLLADHYLSRFTKFPYNLPLIALLIMYAKKVIRKITSTSLKGATVLVTGGGMGIGRELTRQLTLEGANVVIWDINIEKAKDVQELCQHNEGKVIEIMEVDVSKEDSVMNYAHDLFNNDIQPEIIVSNAGIVINKTFMESSIKEIKKVFDVNFFGQVNLGKAFLPKMITRKRQEKTCWAHFVQVSSLASVVPGTQMASYYASKAANSLLTKCLRLELRNDVTFSLICPQFISTGMFKGQKHFFSIHPELSEKQVAQRMLRAIKCREKEIQMHGHFYWIYVLSCFLPPLLVDWFVLLVSGNSLKNMSGRKTTAD